MAGNRRRGSPRIVQLLAAPPGLTARSCFEDPSHPNPIVEAFDAQVLALGLGEDGRTYFMAWDGESIEPIADGSGHGACLVVDADQRLLANVSMPGGLVGGLTVEGTEPEDRLRPAKKRAAAHQDAERRAWHREVAELGDEQRVMWLSRGEDVQILHREIATYDGAGAEPAPRWSTIEPWIAALADAEIEQFTNTGAR